MLWVLLGVGPNLNHQMIKRAREYIGLNTQYAGPPWLVNADGWLICNAFCGACVRSQELVSRSCIEDFELNEAQLGHQALISRKSYVLPCVFTGARARYTYVSTSQ